MDHAAADEFVDDIARRTGSIDIVFNAIGPLAKEYGNGKSAVDLTIEEFMVPLTTVLKSQFITARAAARHMVKQHSGVIILLTGGPARTHVQGTSAIGAAFGAIESLTRNLALDFSPSGVFRCQSGVPSFNRYAGLPDYPAKVGRHGQRGKHHQGPSDRGACKPYPSEDLPQGLRHRQGSRISRFRPCAHDDRNGPQLIGRCRRGLVANRQFVPALVFFLLCRDNSLLGPERLEASKRGLAGLLSLAGSLLHEGGLHRSAAMRGLPDRTPRLEKHVLVCF